MTRSKVDIFYDAYEKDYIKFASLQINKILSMLKRQLYYDYTVYIISHLEYTNFKFIDRSTTTFTDQTNSDGYISSGKVFFYECKESDTKEERFNKFTRVRDGRIAINIRENCYINPEPMLEYILRDEPMSFKVYKMSTVNNQLFDSDEYHDLIVKNKEKSLVKCDNLCIISFDYKSRFTGLINFYKNEHFDKESKDLLPDGIFFKDIILDNIK